MLIICLRYVLDALRMSSDSKLFKFGLFAMSRYKDRLKEWPQYCAIICDLPHANTLPPELISICQTYATGITSAVVGPADHGSYVLDRTVSAPPVPHDEPAPVLATPAGPSGNLLLQAAEAAHILRPSDMIYDKVL